jgi:hypothetical protein
MPKERPTCADCGKKLSEVEARWSPDYYEGRCRACRGDYETCITCGDLRHLRDMRQSYCVDCRREYDRARWARQREARA